MRNNIKIFISMIAFALIGNPVFAQSQLNCEFCLSKKALQQCNVDAKKADRFDLMLRTTKDFRANLYRCDGAKFQLQRENSDLKKENKLIINQYTAAKHNYDFLKNKNDKKWSPFLVAGLGFAVGFFSFFAISFFQ